MKKIFKFIKNHFFMRLVGWHSLDSVPPNKRLQIKDKNGNVALAEPTYYPFEIKHLEGDEKNPYGWKGTPVFYEKGVEKWDGGWLVLYEGLVNKIDSEILFWRNISDKKFLRLYRKIRY